MRKRKTTGELLLFKNIWDERHHVCGVCGERLPWFDVKLCAHVLSKGAHPAMRLDKENIELLCFPHHHELDHHTHRASEDKRFDYIFKKQEELKAKYYGGE